MKLRISSPESVTLFTPLAATTVYDAELAPSSVAGPTSVSPDFG